MGIASISGPAQHGHPAAASPKQNLGQTLQFNQRVNVLLFCSQEEIRIQATTVFVDPYEEADAQVSMAFSHLIGWRTLKLSDFSFCPS